MECGSLRSQRPARGARPLATRGLPDDGGRQGGDGLHDLREGSETEGAGYVVQLDAEAPAALAIPPGVAHGFYFHEPSLHVYAVSHEWDPTDELGCRWDDPALGIAWSCSKPLISDRDRDLGPLSALRDAWRAALAAAAH